MTSVAAEAKANLRLYYGAASVQNYARLAGALMLVSIVAGGFGEMYVPNSLMVHNDASATAQKILASESLFRLGFAAYLLEAVCDVILSLLFYILLRPVRRDVALLSAFFGLVSTSVFAAAELFYFATLTVLRSGSYLRSFSADQLNEFALLSLKLYALGGAIFLALYGIASILRGFLIFRSRFLPATLGVLLMIGGLGFIANNAAHVLAPASASGLLLLPMAIAGLPLLLWLLIKGVDAPTWEASAIAMERRT